MKNILLGILLLLSSSLSAQVKSIMLKEQTLDLKMYPVVIKTSNVVKYKVSTAKVIGWLGMTIAGGLWGGREAYYADNTVFERHFGVGKYDFGGSHEWERKYAHNRYNDGLNKRKTQLFGNFGTDYWHTSKYVVFTIGIPFTFNRSASNQKIQYRLLDIVIGGILYSTASNLTYNYLRK